MSDFKKRNTNMLSYLGDKMAAASVKYGLTGGELPEVDIALMKATNHDNVRREYTAPVPTPIISRIRLGLPSAGAPEGEARSDPQGGVPPG